MSEHVDCTGCRGDSSCKSACKSGCGSSDCKSCNSKIAGPQIRTSGPVTPPSLDLSRVRERVLTEQPALTGQEYVAAEQRYLDYWVTIKSSPNPSLDVPDRLVDSIWHAHILHTKQYMTDTQAYFGYFLHHEPKATEDTQSVDSRCKCCGHCPAQ